EDHHHELDEREPGLGLVIASHGVRMLHTAPLAGPAVLAVRSTPSASRSRSQATRASDQDGPGIRVSRARSVAIRPAGLPAGEGRYRCDRGSRRADARPRGVLAVVGARAATDGS